MAAAAAALAPASWPGEAPAPRAERLPQAYLPDVQDVMGLRVDLECVENQVAVSSVEEAVPLMLHGDQLQVFDSPDLVQEGTERGLWEATAA